MRVLIFDADVYPEDFEASLKPQGYEVEAALDEAEALRKIQENPPDILVARDSLPNMDGWRLIESLRATPRFDALKIIVLRWARHEFSRTDLQKIFAEAVTLWRVSCILVTPIREDILVQVISNIAADKPLDKIVY